MNVEIHLIFDRNSYEKCVKIGLRFKLVGAI